VYEGYGGRDTDWSAVLAKVVDARPDVLFVPDVYNRVNLIARQARAKGVQAVLLGGDGWDSTDLDVATLEGSYFSNHYAPSDPRPLVQSFVKRYRAAYNRQPDALAVLAYDAANLLFTAIDQAHTTDTEQVRRVLRGIRFEGVSGQIAFQEGGDPVKGAAIIHIVDGKKEFVKFVAP
jgi:branched-chain amino acid transport system substrate-binding protein